MSPFARVAPDLVGCSADCLRLMQRILDGPDRPRTTVQLAAEYGIGQNTLATRFYRAGMPGAKLYVAYGNLIAVAALREQQHGKRRSIAWLSVRCGHSSPQALGRSIRTFLGVPASEFVQEWTVERLVERFRAELVLPYLDQLRTLRPIDGRGCVP